MRPLIGIGLIIGIGALLTVGGLMTMWAYQHMGVLTQIAWPKFHPAQLIIGGGVLILVADKILEGEGL